MNIGGLLTKVPLPVSPSQAYEFHFGFIKNKASVAKTDEEMGLDNGKVSGQLLCSSFFIQESMRSTMSSISAQKILSET